MNRLLTSQDATSELNRAIRNHFVRVHVGLRAAPGLPYTQRKVFVEFSFDNFVARLNDQMTLVWWQLAKLFIDEGSRLFENAKCADHLAWHTVAANIEVM